MRHYSFILTLILLGIFGKIGSTQEYLFDTQTFTTEDGLSALLTNGIYQDSKGYLWIGTKHGLDRYDGYNFESYNQSNNSIRKEGLNSRLSVIIEDDQGNLWLNIGYLDRRLQDVFDPTTEKAVPLHQYLNGQLPTNESIETIISRHPKGVIYLRTTAGNLYSYEQKQLGLIRRGLTDVIKIVVDNNEHIWIAQSPNKLIHLDENGQVLSTQYLDYPILGLHAFVKENKNLLRIILKAKDGGRKLYSFWYKEENKNLIEPLVFLNDQQERIYPHTLIYNEIGLWIVAYEQRIGVFDRDGKWLFDLPFSFADLSFIQDIKNVGASVWITTKQGLLKVDFKKNLFQSIKTDSISFDYRGITEDENGNIYFLNSRLFQWNPASNSIQKFSAFTGTYQLIYKDSIIWASIYSERTRSNLGREFNLASGEILDYYTEEGIYALSKLPTDDPNEFIIGHSSGISFINLKRKKVIPFEQYNEFDVLKTLSVYHLHRNASGVWLATSGGIFLLDEAKGITHHFNKASGHLPFDHINHIYEDQKGIFWLSTGGGGMIRWKLTLDAAASEHTQLTTEDGLSHDFLYAAYGDEYNNLWVSSDKGLMRIDQKTLEVYIYSTKDGLPHNEFNTTSHYQAKDGSLYFGGLGGIIRFHPDDISRDSIFDLPMHFTACQLLKEEDTEMTDQIEDLIADHEITISPTDKLLEVQFALLDYDQSENHRYAYQIEGYDNNWRVIEENFLRITHLPYGDYRLKIRGKNIKKGWSKQELVLQIHVPKPFYLQWWFLTSLFLLAVGLIYIAIRQRISRLNRDRERLEVEVQKRTQKIEEDKKLIERQAEALKELDKSKTRFFSNITHEFRTPLTLIIGPAKQLIEEVPPPNIFKRRMNGILKNAQQLLSLINQMLDLSKIESGNMQIEVTRGDIVEYTQSLVKRFEVLFEQKNQRFSFVTNVNQWETNFDSDKWNKIIYNLLSNAIKYTPANKSIQMSLLKTMQHGQESIRLDVKDTGLGIKEEQLGEIFNRFYQVDDSSRRVQGGTGIGLALVKELVELQGGEILVSSQPKHGTTFEIHLPILAAEQLTTLNTRKKSILPIITKSEIGTPEKISIPVENNNEKLEVLLIEDNEEMREYICSCLDAKRYNITQAVNGEDGLMKAQALVPDLIISDVMMPKKDGFEVVEGIRENLLTSHIPIILLTAKASLESRLEGLKRGADVYLTKPFSPQELKLRIKKLIEIRQLLRERYQGNLLDDKDETYQQEDQFITDLRSYILEHLDESKLNGDIIGQHIGMSRVHLYRKLKALTNQSISEFVKQIRLERAKELLLEGHLNISEVTYQTGFSSISYFSRAFKKAYGKSPSEM